MAFDPILTKILLEGGAEVKRQLESIGKAGSQSLDKLDQAGKKGATSLAALDKSITRANVSFVTAQSTMGRIGSSLVGLGSSFTALARSVAIAGVAFAGVAAVVAPLVVGLIGLAKAAANTTDEIRDAAIAAGTTVQTFAELGFAAEQSGTNAGALSRALTVISDVTSQAIEVGSRSAGEFQKLGINLVDAAGKARDSGEVFKDFADKVAAIENPANRAAAVVAVFGRRFGAQLVQSLELGRDGLQAMAKDASALGIVFSKVETEVGDRLNDAFDRLGAASTGLRTKLGLAFAPEFTDLINSLANAVAKAIPFFQRLAESASKQLAAGFTFIGKVMTVTLIPAFEKVGQALQLFTDAINAIFGTNLNIEDVVAFAAIMTTLAVAIASVVAIAGGLMAALSGLGFLIGTIISPFLAIGSVISALAAGFASLVAVAGTVVAAVNPISLAIIAVAIAVGALVGVLLSLDWSGLTESAATAWEQVVQFASDAVDSVVNLWNSVVERVATIWESLVSLAQGVWDSIKGVFAAGVAAINAGWSTVKAAAESAWNSIRNVAVGALDAIRSAVQGVIDFMNDLWEAAKRAASAIASAVGGGGGGEGEGRAAGGRIVGPGTGTSDSIPAWLSAGEWVIRAAAVKKYGHQLFAALNNMQLPANAIKKLLGHASGGPVNFDLGSAIRMPALRFAEGGSVVQERITLDLILAGEAFEGLMAPREVADRLIKFALNEQVRSGGRKPGWYR